VWREHTPLTQDENNKGRQVGEGFFCWWQIPVWFYPAGSGTIGNIQFDVFGKGVVRAGSVLTNRPSQTSKKRTNSSSPPRANGQGQEGQRTQWTKSKNIFETGGSQRLLIYATLPLPLFL
jgi:hypothetical protein